VQASQLQAAPADRNAHGSTPGEPLAGWLFDRGYGNHRACLVADGAQENTRGACRPQLRGAI
jgi:hypothetical protein